MPSLPLQGGSGERCQAGQAAKFPADSFPQHTVGGRGAATLTS